MSKPDSNENFMKKFEAHKLWLQSEITNEPSNASQAQGSPDQERKSADPLKGLDVLKSLVRQPRKSYFDLNKIISLSQQEKSQEGKSNENDSEPLKSDRSSSLIFPISSLLSKRAERPIPASLLHLNDENKNKEQKEDKMTKSEIFDKQEQILKPERKETYEKIEVKQEKPEKSEKSEKSEKIYTPLKKHSEDKVSITINTAKPSESYVSKNSDDTHLKSKSSEDTHKDEIPFITLNLPSALPSASKSTVPKRFAQVVQEDSEEKDESSFKYPDTKLQTSHFLNQNNLTSIVHMQQDTFNISSPEISQFDISSGKLDLHQRNILWQKKKEDKLRKQREAEKDKDLEGCTFKPKIHQLNEPHSGVPTNLYPRVENKLPLHERTKLWKASKQAKIDLERENNKDKDLVGCTFQPNLVQNCKNFLYKKKMNYDMPESKVATSAYPGYEEFMKRQEAARHLKEDKQKVNPNFRSIDYEPKEAGIAYGKNSKLVLREKSPLAPRSNFTSNVENYSTPKRAYETSSTKNAKSVNKSQDMIRVNDVTFIQAVRILHQELHQMNF